MSNYDCLAYVEGLCLTWPMFWKELEEIKTKNIEDDKKKLLVQVLIIKYKVCLSVDEVLI
jgi:hypothetical protein